MTASTASPIIGRSETHLPRPRLKPAAAIWGTLLLLPAAGPGRAASPAEATAFIRVTGNVRAEYTVAWKETVEEQEVELGTGSGFVVAPLGYVVTNHHVIRDQEFSVRVGERDVLVRLEVKKIEVVLPGPGGATRGLVAAVEAVDAEEDLAVLSVPSADLPFLHLGDSDALEPGQPVQAWGFPFGRQVEVGRASAPDIVPAVSVSRGSVAARRDDDSGATRYLQTDATVNPGNSGGPLVDERGYVVGVIRMKLGRAEDIGFAIPINRVKDFLAAHGFDAALPSRRLRLAAAQSFPWKGLRLQLPDGFEDASPARLALDAGADEIRIVVERVASPWTLAELESLLVSGRGFHRFAPTGPPRSRPTTLAGGPAVAGSVRGTPERGGDQEMEYALVDLGGREKLVARCLGREHDVAFNRSVLRGVLASVEADRLLTAEVQAPVPVARLEPAALSGSDGPAVPVPSRWSREPAVQPASRGLPEPDAGLSASPEGDFTVSFRAFWWRASALAPDRAAAARSARRGGLGSASYVSAASALGIPYLAEGLFVRHGEGLLQLEAVSPQEKGAFLRDLLAAWVAEAQRVAAAAPRAGRGRDR